MLNRRAFLATAGAALVTGPAASLAQAPPGKKLRIVVIANRDHEADGLMAALCNRMKQNPNLSVAHDVHWPRAIPVKDPQDDRDKPRCLIDILKDPSGNPLKDSSGNPLSATMEIWCIDDLAITKGVSADKATAMDLITNYTKPASAPDGVVAFGTAAYPGLASNNGCATIGGAIYIHNAAKDVPGNPGGTWEWPGYMEKVIPNNTPASFFTSVAADSKILDAISREMIAPQLRPADLLQLFIAADAVGISSVNIPPPLPGSPPPYCDIDTKAVTLAQKAGATSITSIETTHGVIRSKWDKAPFIYVTAIPNRLCHFPDEASQNYAQEFPSSHNAGVALKYVIPYFAAAIA